MKLITPIELIKAIADEMLKMQTGEVTEEQAILNASRIIIKNNEAFITCIETIDINIKEGALGIPYLSTLESMHAAVRTLIKEHYTYVAGELLWKKGD